MTQNKPKIFVYDVETAPLQTYSWGIHEQNIAVNQIVSDWHLLSWAGKWLGSKTMFYMDQRRAKDVTNDKAILRGLWEKLDEADIVLTQNGKQFDQKKVYARFIEHGMKPPSPSRHLDTKQIAKRNFGFTSNSLEHLSNKLSKMKKSDHKKFPGMELWKECLAGNREAFKEMEKYNKQDVLVTEAIFNKLRVWDNSISLAFDNGGCRNCGSYALIARGYTYTTAGKWQSFQCKKCGSWCRSAINELSKFQRANMKRRAA